MLKKGHQKIKNPENAENGPPAVHFEIIRVQASPPKDSEIADEKKNNEMKLDLQISCLSSQPWEF